MNPYLKKCVILFCSFYILHPAESVCQELRFGSFQTLDRLNGFFPGKLHAQPAGFGQQAIMAYVVSTSVSVWQERSFGMSGRDRFQFGMIYPTGNGNFGLMLHHFGAGGLNESSLGFSYGRKLGKISSAGLQINAVQIRIPGYVNKVGLIADFAGHIGLSDQITAGIHVHNPGALFLSAGANEFGVAVFSAGFGYRPSESFSFSSMISGEQTGTISFMSGIQYAFEETFFLQAAYSSDAGIFHGAAGLGWNQNRLDLMASFHPVLGVSSGCRFTKWFGK